MAYEVALQRSMVDNVLDTVKLKQMKQIDNRDDEEYDEEDESDIEDELR